MLWLVALFLTLTIVNPGKQADDFKVCALAGQIHSIPFDALPVFLIVSRERTQSELRNQPLP